MAFGNPRVVTASPPSVPPTSTRLDSQIVPDRSEPQPIPTSNPNVLDSYTKAEAYMMQGDLQVHKSLLDSAIESYLLSQKFYIAAGNGVGEANTHHSLGITYYWRDKLHLTEQSFQAALQLYLKLNNKQGEANARVAISNLHSRHGRLDASEESYKAALRLYEEVGNQLGQAEVLTRIGDIQQRRMLLDSAKQSYEKALQISIEHKNQLQEGHVRKSMGDLFTRIDNVDDARKNSTVPSISIPMLEILTVEPTR
ncbi:hypothetical protein DL96DRAFT_1788147 [Flagelloscypha sp. PMI_526]|nr:hypothetical protein DL96DRAFT_1788147 [Flagelloscypha sp. PMI_526]